MGNHQPCYAVIQLIGTLLSRDGSVIDRFVWNHKHQSHIYEGRELTAEEFNETWDDLNATYKHFQEGIRPVFYSCRWKNLEKANQAKKEPG